LDNDIIFEIAERNCWMSDIDRLVNLYWAVGQALHFGVEGDVVEIGCHAGGTSAFLQMLIDNFAPGRTLHLYDSFQGVPEPGPKDAYLVKGDRPSTIDQVHETFAHFGLPVPEIVRGHAARAAPAEGRGRVSRWRLLRLDHDQLARRVAAAVTQRDHHCG
jgi:O-methyltransferase